MVRHEREQVKDAGHAGLERRIGFLSATVVVIANMVGTGIFTTSGYMLQGIGHPMGLFLSWAAAGLLALCGALCYGELGAMYPRAGGEYVFLKESFGPLPAFLSGWVSLIVGFSAPIAAASVAFASYAVNALGPLKDGFPDRFSFSLPFLTFSPVTMIAVCVILCLTGVHYHSLFFGKWVQGVLTGLKIGLMVVIILAAMIYGEVPHDALRFTGGWRLVFSQGFAISLIYASFAYSGWNSSAYMGAEIKDPGRIIPLSLFWGTAVVVILYLFMNLAYVLVLPAAEMSGLLEVAGVAAAKIFGPPVSRAVNGCIALSILSVISVMIMTGPRVYFALARDGLFFRIFGVVREKGRTPGHAVLLQSGIATLMVLTASFEALLVYVGFTLGIFTALTVVGMVTLRKRVPTHPRPYKAFGYPLTPAIFVCGNLWIAGFSIMTRPVASLFGLGTIMAGLLVYRWFASRVGRSPIVEHP
jgi:APA family basic amino acid/polyamine antiporter